MIAIKRIRSSRRGGIPKAFSTGAETMAEKLLTLCYAAGSPMQIEFKGSAWKSAKDPIKREARGKCAYCESSTSVAAHGDVEHFRPKKPYWDLAYCYDNYLFSCQICNQSYKGNRFPISGTRLATVTPPMPKPAGAVWASLVASLAWDSSALDDNIIRQRWSAEDADLVHPYLEDPEPLLRYEVDDVNREVWVRSAGGERADRAAQAMEDCLGINREELRRNRYQTYDHISKLKVLRDQGLPPEAIGIVDGLLVNMQSPEYPYAGMHRYFARLWDLPSRL